MLNAIRAASLHPLRGEAAKISGVYALFSLLWIFGSDRLLLFFVRDPERLTQIQSYKGAGFVLLTASLLYALVTRSRLRLQESMQVRDRMKSLGELGQMASGLAHDFNNVLCVIYGMAELAQDGLHPQDSARKELEDLLRAAQSGHKMVERLMATGLGQEPSGQRLDLKDLWLDNQGLLRKLLRKGIVVEESLASVEVEADPIQLLQVLMNFFVNANHAMPDGGRLSVSCGPGPEGALLKVSDNGSGMDQAVQASIFKPFFSTKGAHGKGLGLATVYAIVHKLGGRIEVESQMGAEHGSAFSVHLPLAA